MYYGCPPGTLLRTFWMVASSYRLVSHLGRWVASPGWWWQHRQQGLYGGSLIFFLDLSCWPCRRVLLRLAMVRHLFCVRVFDPFSPIGGERICGWGPPTCDATYFVVVDIGWG